MKPQEQAYLTVLDVLDDGLAQGHPEGGWKHMPAYFHYMKAIRHATTHVMETTGVLTPSGENHAKLALCRLSMGLCVEQGNGEKQS